MTWITTTPPHATGTPAGIAGRACPARRRHRAPRHAAAGEGRGGHQGAAAAGRLRLDERAHLLRWDQVRRRPARREAGGRRGAGRHPGRPAGVRVGDRRAQGAEPESLHRHQAGTADRPAEPRQAVPRRRLVRGQGRDPDRVLAGQGGRRPRPVRQAGADPDLRRRGELRRRPLPGRPPAGQGRGGPAVQRHRARGQQQGPQAAAVHRQGRRRQLLRRRPTPPTWRTRSAGSPSGRCGPSRPPVRRWRAPSTRPGRRRSASASTRTSTTRATPRATTGSPGPPGRP